MTHHAITPEAPAPVTIGTGPDVRPAVFGGTKLALIAGPCLAESRELVLMTAYALRSQADELGIELVFKASYDKANRSSVRSHRGPGLEEGLTWLAEARRETATPVITDIHEPGQAQPVGETLDAIQIPAFLCRQTDLLTAAGRTGKPVNVKKGQFMAPWDMSEAVAKVRSTGNEGVLLTERGTSFGYNRLITDMRGLAQMRRFAPVVFDATHSTQEPGGLGSASGGQAEYAPLLAGAALAAGADALFIETHPDPPSAMSDAACQIPLADLPAILRRCLAIHHAARTR